MKLSTDLVGQKLKGLTRRVAWRQTTNYAAAVGETNPRYFDDTRPEGLIAPPLFAVAVTWPLMTDVSNQLPALPPEVIPTMVHAGEHLLFHRPVKADDKLTLSGEVVALLPGKAGTRLVLRSDAADAKGEPVFTEYGIVLFRGVSCEREVGADNLPPVPVLADVEPLWDIAIDVAPKLSYIYDGCSDIVFPIHTSPAFAQMVGLPGIILQGTATLALAARELVDRELDGDPARLRAIACSFRAMVLPGTTIRLQLLKRENDALGYCVLNAEGQVALQDGYAQIT